MASTTLPKHMETISEARTRDSPNKQTIKETLSRAKARRMVAANNGICFCCSSPKGEVGESGEILKIGWE